MAILIYTYIIVGRSTYFSKTYEHLGEILGCFRNILIPYLLLSIFSDFILDSNKRTVFLTRLNFFFVLLICFINLQLLFYINNLGIEDLEKKIFVFLYVDKNLGMLITMILYKFYFGVPININITVTGVVLFFSLFILFGKIIGNIVRKIVKYYLKENREKRKKIKKLIKEKVKIKKQIIEKEKHEKIEKEKQTIIENKKEREIKEMISEIRKKMNKDS